MGNWWERSAPEELPLVPWLHPAVIGYLNNLIQPDWRILEHGSGGSTLWFAQRAAHVTAVESDASYYAALFAQAPGNVTLILRAAENLPLALDAPYDLLLIDGEIERRGLYLYAAEQLVKPGGLVVLDNANRTEYVNERTFLKERAAHYITFEVNPPHHKYCVTDFYRLRGGERTWI
jgi:predicted O-methyltransferase YrrM